MMQLGVDPKKNQIPGKSLGIVMIVIGVVLSCSAVGGFSVARQEDNHTSIAQVKLVVNDPSNLDRRYSAEHV